MFTKFNRVLLASGLVLTSLVGFGSSAFAEPGEAEVNAVLTGQLPAVATMTWADTPSDHTFPIPVSATPALNLQIGKLNYASNVDWKITIYSTNSGVLETGDGEGATKQIPYTVSLGNFTDVQPGASGTPALLASGNIASEGSLDVADAPFKIKITGSTAANVTGKYQDTVYLKLQTQY